jgi:hypothetical protein
MVARRKPSRHLGPVFLATLLALFGASGAHAQEFSDTTTMLLTLNAWLIVVLIAVPWLVIISAPILFVLMVPASAVLGPAYVALKTTLVGERKRRERAAPETSKLRVFVPEVPRLRNVRDKLEALLAGHQERIPARTGVCACLLERGRRVFLTVRFFQDRRYWSHQVKPQRLSLSLPSLAAPPSSQPGLGNPRFRREGVAADRRRGGRRDPGALPVSRSSSTTPRASTLRVYPTCPCPPQAERLA